MTTPESFRSAFEASLAHGPAALRDLRRAAYARFVALGLPTTRDEDWKYTSLAPVTRTTFGPAPVAATVTLDDLKPLTFGVLGKQRLVFVDGRLVPSLSTPVILSEAPVILSEAPVILSEAPVILSEAKDPAACVSDRSDAFGLLNDALASDGARVAVPAGTVVEDPLYLYFYSTGADGDAPATAVANTLVASRGSQLTVIEAYGGAPGARYFTSAFTHVVVEDGAVVDHVKLQRESTAAFHVARLAVAQARSSRFTDCSINLGAALYRYDIDVRFEGEGGECSLDGLFMVGGEQHTDTHTRIDHAKPRCSSRELYKGVLDGTSRGVFHGRILVRKDAQKTDAHQANKNLLLSRGALVNSTPQLEILADDVKCKHGSTTGQLDAAALFYLRSRGISEADARSLLTYAFASDLVQRVPIADVRAGLEAYLQARLPVAEAEEAVA